MQSFEKEFTEEDALNQYSALIHVVLDMLESKKRECRMVFIALICSLIANVIITADFLYYESQWDYTDTITTTTEQEVSGNDSEINNVKGDQYKDNSVHNDGKEK